MRENMFGNIPINPSERPVEPRSKDGFAQKKSGLEIPDRRSFVKKALLVGAGIAVSGLFSSSQKEKPEFSLEVEELRRNLSLETAGQADIKKTDEKVIGQTIEKQIESKKDYITLDSATRQAIYQSWRQEYAPGGFNFNHGIIGGIERMKPWMEEMRQAFQKNGIDEKYIFLAIAESNFDLDAVSKKRAVGPFQITPDTAKDYQMIVTKDYDERLDPIKSSEVCARHLKDNYERYGRDMNLTLMDYNGGYTKEYLKHIIAREKNMFVDEATRKNLPEHQLQPGEMLEPLAKRYGTSVTLFKRFNPEIKNPEEDLMPEDKIKIPPKRELSMEDFKSWIEKRMNEAIRKELKNSTYIVKSGEYNLRKISEKFDVDYELLKGVNMGIHENNLKSGQSIHIPASYRDHKEEITKILSDYNQNINYPEKFHAIFDIIEENALTPKPGIAPKKEIFKIQKGASLAYVANLKGIELKKLIAKNPAVLDSRAILPPGATIYI